MLLLNPINLYTHSFTLINALLTKRPRLLLALQSRCLVRGRHCSSGSGSGLSSAARPLLSGQVTAAVCACISVACSLLASRFYQK